MDERRFTFEDSENMEKEDPKSLCQTQTAAINTSSDESANVTVMTSQHTTSVSHTDKSELKPHSLDSGNVDDKGQEGNILDDVGSSLELDNHIRNKVSPTENQNQIEASDVSSSSGVDSHELPSSSVAAGCLLLNDAETAGGYRPPTCKTDYAGKLSQHASATNETTVSGQVTETHNRVSVSSCDLHRDRKLHKTVSGSAGTAEVDVDTNKNDRVVGHCGSMLSSVPKQISMLNKEKSMHTFTYTPTSVDTSVAEMYSLMEPSGGAVDTSSDSSVPFLQQQVIEDNFVACTATVYKSPEPPASSYNEEAFVSYASIDFQPIILDVRGGYHEMEVDDDVNESQSLTSSVPPLVSQVAEGYAGKSTDAPYVSDSVESFSTAASELLQDMVQHSASVSEAHTETSFKGKIVTAAKACSFAETESVNSSLSLTETTSDAIESSHSGKSGSSLAESLFCNTDSEFNTQTTVISRVADKPVSDSGLIHMPVRMPLPANSKAPPIIILPVSSESQPNRPSQLISDIQISNGTETTGLQTTYSCVLLQDNTNAKTGKMAFLIPQSSFSSLGNPTAVTSSTVSKTPLIDVQTNAKSSHSNHTRTIQSSADLLVNGHTPVLESISQLVTNTMSGFCLQGKDLKCSSLLKVAAPKKNEYSQYVVKCSVCGEGYYDEEGLNFHLKRPVFHLSFDCSHCKQKIVFYNKCSLWMHLKEETKKPVLNYNDILYLKPYEFDAEDDSDDQILERVDAASSSEASGASVCAIDASKEHNVPASTTPLKEVITVKSVAPCMLSITPACSNSKEQSHNLSKCSVCLKKVPDLTAHLSSITLKKYICAHCGMFLPNFCAREAHLKIHYGAVKNMSCPECGEKDFKSIHEGQVLRSVFDHVDSCKHFNRILIITCFCNKELNSISMLVKHFIESHLRTLFKCPFCVLAFTQRGHLVGHMDNVHKIKGIDIAATVLCLFCQQIIKSVVELRGHVNQHVDNFKNNFIFKWKCFMCTRSCVDKAELNKHVELDHPHKPKRCTFCYSLFGSRKNLVDHIVQKKCSGSLAQKLNFCVDMQPEVSQNVAETVALRKLFEVKQIAPSAGGECGTHGIVPLLNTNQLRFVNIVPKSASGQLAVGKQNSQPQEKQSSLQRSNPTPLAKHQKQINPVVLSTSNSFTDKASPQPRKIIITGKSSSSIAGKGICVNAIVTQCVVCKKLIESTKLTDHLKFHQSQGVIICFHCQRRDFTTVEEAIKHSDVCGHNMLEGIESQKGSRSESSRAEEVADEASRGGGQLDLEPNEHQQVETEGKAVDSQTHQIVFPCLLCGLAFQTLSAREEHVSRSHDGTRIVYHCALCRKRGKTKVFIKKELVLRHITKKHRIVNMDTVSRLIRTEEQNVSSGQKLTSSEPAPGEAEGVSAPKRLRVSGEGDYMCGKCGFSCSDPAQFSEHISSHNFTKEPQCPECGLCFTILPALKKHLLAVHKIKAVDDYLKTKNIAEPELEEEELDTLPEVHPFSKPVLRSHDCDSDKSNISTKVFSSNPLECTVCYKVFDVETNLKTHMRNHGMAFIRSKRHKV